jgi:ribosome biogenesis GTPase
MKNKNRGQKIVRTRDWEDKHELSFTHDRAKHRKALGAPVVPYAPPIPADQVKPNAVILSHSGHYAFVHHEGEEKLCVLDPILGDPQSTVLAAGDEVLVEFIEEAPYPVVRAVLERRSKLSRLAHVHSKLAEQVIAANIDFLVVVASALKPRFKPGLVDRYLITADIGGVCPVVVINKIDLVDEEPEELAGYRELGFDVFTTSCVTGTGIDSLRETLRGKLSVFAGHSGVGKSSLLNALDPALDLTTNEVSAANDKGRHTTTGARLHFLKSGLRIIDTPGARNLGIWGVSYEEIAYYFPELAEIATSCRFRNCTHTHEPDCAVRDAVETGAMSKRRYDSYLRIRASLQD